MIKDTTMLQGMGQDKNAIMEEIWRQVFDSIQ
jgi:hypothetical protein